MRFNRNAGRLAGARCSLENFLFGGRHAVRAGCNLDDTRFDVRVLDTLLDFPDKELGDLLQGSCIVGFRCKHMLARGRHDLHSRLAGDLFAVANVALDIKSCDIDYSIDASISRLLELVDGVGDGARPAAEDLLRAAAYV